MRGNPQGHNLKVMLNNFLVFVRYMASYNIHAKKLKNLSFSSNESDSAYKCITIAMQ